MDTANTPANVAKPIPAIYALALCVQLSIAGFSFYTVVAASTDKPDDAG